ncbi:hypothetical protein F7725_022342 [Dissostichus mawsoni]|uniref:Dickkopf N-terminal cysteine-rich domain-containing protein n=1 Tax=Dissostichus mawsoni TaxID=36200 RepID=A0A7J5Z0I5_DISMA|nr:hypothetical protein F7725_022342 [Dissostichus mawsoni]
MCALSASLLGARWTGTQTGEMSGIRLLLLVSLSLSLWVRSGAEILPGALQRGPASLNDMFREVEERWRTRSTSWRRLWISAKSSSTFLDLHTNPHDETRKMTKDEDRLFQVLDRADNECMVDEDCGALRYCLYGIQSSKCLPCIPTDMPCTKDEECCSDQMCVWGQCTVNATSGAEGTICQGQSDCSPPLCCAFQRELLFPVCNPRPERGESCVSHPNLLMDMLAWDQEGPRDHCPCADSLQCQPQGRGSVCGE